MRARVAIVAFAAACLAAGSATALSEGISGPGAVDAVAVRVSPPFHPHRTPAERAARDLVDLVNDERSRRGLPILIWDDAVADSAVSHSVDMAARRSMSHIGSDGSDTGRRLERTGFSWLNWGEAVGAGFTTPQPLFDAWMGSPSHRQHLIGGDRFVGVGVAVTPDGVTYWTLVVAS